jgi:hypothetical protein
MMCCLGGIQIASAQARNIGGPGPAALKAMPDNSSTAIEVKPNPGAAPAAAGPAGAQPQTVKKTKAKVDRTKMQPDDPRKSPFWEPRDWSHIYEQAP